MTEPRRFICERQVTATHYVVVEANDEEEAFQQLKDTTMWVENWTAMADDIQGAWTIDEVRPTTGDTGP
jgi:hypothetical protein